MLNLSDNFAIVAISALAVTIVIWGYNRAKPYGELGILAWLQSLTLTAPWLVFFALLVMGIYINLIGVVFLLVTSAAFYIYLGNLIRQKAQNKIDPKTLSELLQKKAGIKIEKIITENDNPNDSSSSSEVGQKENAPGNESTSESKDQKQVISVTFGGIVNELSTIPEEEVKEIKTIFDIDTFFAIETIPYQEGVIVKGNLRGEPDHTHSRLTEKLNNKFGDKYRLFLVETPEEKPIVIILPSKNDPKPLSLAQKNVALVLLLSTIFTSMEGIALLLGFDLVGEWSRYQEVLPFAIGLWTILIGQKLPIR